MSEDTWVGDDLIALATVTSPSMMVYSVPLRSLLH